MNTIFSFVILFYSGWVGKTGSQQMNDKNLFFPAYHSFILPDSCIDPFLLSSTFSHLRWPFPSGSWTQRNFWLGANEPGGIGSGWGQGRHIGSHFYAVDWNKVSPWDDCDSGFYAPLGGTVILVRNNCPHNCFGDASCQGNEVVIQSNVDTSYAFSVLHLNNVNAHVGKIVSPGDYIGSIGATGFAIGSHAHCVLFRNINRYLEGITIVGPGPDNHATPFDFSAECGGTGPHNINLNPVTSVSDIEFNMYFSVLPNPTTNTITIIPKTGINNRYFASVYSSGGVKLISRSISGRGYINFEARPAGHYFLVIHTGKKVVKKIIILVH